MAYQVSEEQAKKMGVTFLRSFISYLRYPFYMFNILFYFALVVMAIIQNAPDMSFEFLKHFAFLDSKFADPKASFHMQDMLKLFAFVSLAFIAFKELVRVLLKKFFDIDFCFDRFLTQKRKYLLFFLSYILLFLFIFVIPEFESKLLSFFIPAFIFHFIFFSISIFLSKIRRSVKVIEE